MYKENEKRNFVEKVDEINHKKCIKNILRKHRWKNYWNMTESCWEVNEKEWEFIPETREYVESLFLEDGKGKRVIFNIEDVEGTK